MLAAGATAATPRQQEERPRSDIGQRCGKAQPAVVPTTSICKSLALRLLMLGSSNGAGRGTVVVGIGVEGVALGAAPLGEELVMVEPERRRSSITSTIPTTPTTSAVAVAVAATATRVVLPTCVTVPTPPRRTRASDGYNLITSLARISTKPFDKLRAASVEPRIARRRVRRSEGTCFSFPRDDERGGLQCAIRAERA